MTLSWTVNQRQQQLIGLTTTLKPDVDKLCMKIAALRNRPVGFDVRDIKKAPFMGCLE